ncbi:MAG TPA: hypothetical protein VJB16_02385 [archaeon]|nr:hypothetical protein [archaeon]
MAVPQKPTCPLCGSKEFTQHRGRMDSLWGFTSHKMTLLICNKCQFVMQFSRGRTIWDFD